MQAHPVGATSVSMTQADLCLQAGSIYSLLVHQLRCSAGLEALRPTHSTAVALPVVGCLHGVCQAGVSCVKFPKCPPLRVTRRHTLWVPRVSIRSEEHTSELQSHLNLVC